MRTHDMRTAIITTLLGANVTPSTRLVSLTPDGTGVTIPDIDLPKFNATQLLMWYDGSDEEALPIAEGWDQTNPIPLDFSGMEYDHLQKSHAVDAPLGVHLYRETPADNAFSSALDDPVVWIDIQTETGMWVALPKTNEPTYAVVLEYRLTLNQQRAVGQQDAMMNPTTWVSRVREKAETDMEKLFDALLDNDELTGPNGPTVLGYGNSGQMNAQTYSKRWGDVTVGTTQGGLLQSGSTGILTVRGDWHDYDV